MFGFSLLLVVVASFSFRQVGLSQGELLARTPGMLMLILLFSGVLVLRETSVPEYRQGAALGVALAPVDPWSIYLAKFFTNTAVLFLVFVLNLALLQIFLGLQLGGYWGGLIVLLSLFSLGFSALGTLISMLVYLTAAGEILFPLVLFPLLIPLLIGTVELMRGLFSGVGVLDPGEFWFSFLVLFDAIAFLISLILFEYVLRE
jgi:heme exporter protein B